MIYYLSAPSSCLDAVKDSKIWKTFLSSYAVDAKKVLPLFTSNSEYKLMIDSGAYSVFNKGAVIDIDEYKNFCLKYPKRWHYINLDVIPLRNSSKKDINICAEKGYENYIYLKKFIKNLLPVYHYGEDIKFFKKYCNETDYVCVGIKRVVGELTNDEYYKKIFRISGMNVKIHGLAMTSIPYLFRFPFYSVDSITYQRGKILGKGYWAHGMLRSLLFRSLRYWKYIEEQVTNTWTERGVKWN